MGSAYGPNCWHEFATGLAGATAALTGLVFVAVSIDLEEVLADRFHRRRAESTFISLLVVLGGALARSSHACLARSTGSWRSRVWVMFVSLSEPHGTDQLPANG